MKTDFAPHRGQTFHSTTGWLLRSPAACYCAVLAVLAALLPFVLAAGRPTVQSSGDRAAEASGTEASGTGVAENTSQRLEQNRASLQALSGSELADLVEKKARFDALSDAEQQRIRQLHEQLQNHPQRDELVNIMRRYMEWLKKLEPEPQAKLLDLATADEKVDEVCRLLCLNNSPSAILSQEDAAVFDSWFTGLAEVHAEKMRAAMDKIREHVPSRVRRDLPEVSANPAALLRFVVLRSSRETRRIIGENLHELADGMSPAGREFVMQGEPVQVLRMLIRNPVSSFELQKFYNNQMTAAQRAKLDRLPPEEWKRQIEQLYLRDRQGIAAPELDEIDK